MHDTLTEFQVLFQHWEAETNRQILAENAGSTLTAARARARTEATCVAMLAAQERVSDGDVFALASIARAHNPTLTADSEYVDEAALGRLIDACLALGGRQ